MVIAMLHKLFKDYHQVLIKKLI